MAVETHCKLRKAGGSMVENNRLPDTPWHVGYAKKQENDPRRHKARCIHYRDSLKRCKYCGMFYVDIDDSTRDEIMDIVKADPIFVMNIKRK